MPYIIRPRKLHRIAATLFGTILMLGAIPAAAGADCPSGPTSSPFLQFGDGAEYTLLAGGSFESGAPGWSLNGAEVVAGNESFNVAGGSHSLEIEAGGVAISPAFCVSVSEPSFRFFARQTDPGRGALQVALQYTAFNGKTKNVPVGFLPLGPAWSPGPVLQLARLLPLWQPSSTLSVQLVFRGEGGSGAWAIDDVYIDPYRR
jgi:hypothetical protein